ncbi:MAG: MaoC family dehydratase N-terminal domain-containing protein [Actinomycetota bacterium]|nr:MaoC family dehydratase N-terminal domain-containing protein [Actinomycetota bacterium]
MPEEVLEFSLPVERGKVKEFAVAVGDNNPLFYDREAALESGFPDCVAPPTFTVTQLWAVPREAREERLGSGLDYSRVLHGEQEFIFTRLPVVGEILKGEMRISRDLSKEGKRGGSMRFVTYESIFRDEEGDEVLRGYYTLIETAKDVGR